MRQGLGHAPRPDPVGSPLLPPCSWQSLCRTAPRGLFQKSKFDSVTAAATVSLPFPIALTIRITLSTRPTRSDVLLALPTPPM